MTFFEDAQKIVNYSLTWLKGGYWNLYAIFAVIYFFINLFSGSRGTEQAPLNPATAAVTGLIILVAWIVLICFSFKAFYAAMSTRFKDLRPFNLETVVKLFISGIIMMFASLFSVFEPKWLSLSVLAIALAIAGFVMGATSTASLVLFALAALLAIGYFVIVVRNFSRLYLQSALFLRGEGIVSSIKQCWKVTSGKALKLFGFNVAVGILVIVISVVEILPQVLFNAPLNVAGFKLSPISAVLGGLLSPAVILIQYFAYVAMYEWLLGQKNTTARKTTTKAKAKK